MAFSTSDLLIVNRNSATYKATAGELSNFVIDNINNNSGGGGSTPELILNSLADVTAAAKGAHAARSFLLVDTTGTNAGNYTEVNFDNEVETVVTNLLNSGTGDILLPTSVFQMTDVTTKDAAADIDPNRSDAYYDGTFLLGDKASKKFEATDFTYEVKGVIDQYFGVTLPPTDPDYKPAKIPEKTVDLTDVEDSQAAQDEFLLYKPSALATTEEYYPVSFVTAVEDVINGNGNIINPPGIGGSGIIINGSQVAPAKEWKTGDNIPDKLGVVAVDTSSGLTISADGLLGYTQQTGALPDVLVLRGTVYFNESRNPFEELAGTTAFDPPNDALVGDIYVAQPTSSYTNGKTDPKGPLNGWQSNVPGTVVSVEYGSLVVCIQAGPGPVWAELGVLDYNPVEATLQSVLEAQAALGNTTGVDVPLGDSTISIVSHGSGNDAAIDITKGHIEIDTGNVIIKTEGGFIAGSGPADPDSSVQRKYPLSVDNIDFTRFPDLKDAPTTP